jgi:hypothetical protein
MPWATFIHFWRVEAATSIFLIAFIWYASKKRHKFDIFGGISKREFNLIILPIVAFIIWGAISASWADSWRSAIHHSLVWSEYLIFFLIVRRVLAEKGAYLLLTGMLVTALLFYSVPAISEYVSYLTIGGGLNTGINYQRFGEQATALLPLILLLTLISTGRRFIIGLIAVTGMLLVICGLDE